MKDLKLRDLKLQDLSACVVAWHNSHPLARRITGAHVQSVGYVVLPYLGAAADPAAMLPPLGADSADPHGGATLRERAMARAQGTVDAPGSAAGPSAASLPSPSPSPSRSTLTPAFTDDFIAPLTAAAVGPWAADHGLALDTERADAPVRRVAPVGPLDDLTRLQSLWVLTAQLDVGSAKTRVLVGAGDEGQMPAVLGRRMWSPARIGALAALPVLLGLLAAGLLSALGGLRGGALVPTETRPPLAAASAVAATGLAAPAPSAVASATADGADAADPTRPVDAEPTLGRIVLPSIGPRADERRRAADEARQRAMPSSAAAPASALTPTTAAPAPVRAAVPAPTSSTPPPIANTGRPAFALSTRVLRTRTEGEQVAAAMRALLVTPAVAGTPPMQVEVLPAGEDWRVVGWPYADRALAEKARALLAARGMKVQVIDF